MCFYMFVWVHTTDKVKGRRDKQKVQSSRRSLWANVSLSHPVFASPFARVCFSVTADISVFCSLCVSEWDKKLDDLWAFCGSKQCTKASCLSFPIPLFFSLSATLSILSSLLPRLPGRSLERQCSRMDGWMDGWGDGGWTDGKHLSPIRTEENHIIWFTWHFSWGRLICPSHSSIHLAMMRGHLSHSRQRVRKKKNPWGNRQTGMLRVCKHTQLF